MLQKACYYCYVYYRIGGGVEGKEEEDKANLVFH